MPKNSWYKKRSGWGTGCIEWVENNTIYMSVVFSWQLQEAFQRAMMYQLAGYTVKAGGPAVALNPNLISKVADVEGSVAALYRHNPNATFTTRGCIRHCPFCAVPKLEGALRELPDSEWEPKPLICDNNLLAASVGHFDHVIDRLLNSDVINIDFNQGLDARLLTEHHAEWLARLHQTKQLKMIRLAWDDLKTEKQFRRAHQLLCDAGIPAKRISVYVLVGFNDTPQNALYRLSEIWNSLGSWPYPMRYQPIDALYKNSYVGENWTHEELIRYMEYWSNLIYLQKVPFAEFDRHRKSEISADTQSEVQLF